MNAPLRLENVSIGLDGHALIPPISLAIRPGQTATLMGPSGSGKSTLLALISGTIAPVFATGGRILLGESDMAGIPPERRKIGILFQDDLLFPHLSVGENLAFGLSSHVRGRAARAARIDSALTEAGLAGFARRDPATLSGGQRARVALLRLLLSEPKAMLLDEPFGKLDTGLRADIRQFVFDHVTAAGLPVLMVTHDAADAEAANGPILSLSTDASGEPTIRQAGRHQEVWEPAQCRAVPPAEFNDTKC